jgi:fucose 4-O-acetylase-like acetyltransferase
MPAQIPARRSAVVATLIGLMPAVPQAQELIEIRTADYDPRPSRKPALLVTRNPGSEVADPPKDYCAGFRSRRQLDFETCRGERVIFVCWLTRSNGSPWQSQIRVDRHYRFDVWVGHDRGGLCTLSMAQRLTWIDFAKGIAIFLVVVGHAGRGIFNAGVPDAHGLLALLDKTIYAFHMPLFFILSGITFGLRPPTNNIIILAKKIWRLFYVMAIWTYAFLFLRAMAGDNANASGAWANVLVFPLPPFAHFWFLWALLLNIFVFTICRSVLWRFTSDSVFWAGSLLIVLFVNFLVSVPSPFIPYFSQALHYSVAFVVGAIIAVRPALNNISEPPKHLIAAALFVIVLIVSLNIDLPISEVNIGIIISVCLLPLLIFISDQFSASRWVRFIIYFGALSLPIYVMHTMFSALLRIILLKGGVDDLFVHLALGVVIGVTGPLAVYQIAKRAGMLRVFGFA